MIKTALLFMATLLTVFLFKAYSFAAPMPGDYRPGAAYDAANDRYLLVYETYEASGFSVYGQLIDYDGTPLGGAFLIADGSSSPSIAYDSSNGRFLVTYIKGSGSDAYIYGQRLNNDGTLSGGSLTISDASSYMHPLSYGPAVAYDAKTRKFQVVWDSGNLSTDIYGQLISDDMTKDGANFVISNATNSQRSPCIANDSVNSRFLVVWEDDRNTQYTYQIYGKVLNAEGAVVANDFSISNSAHSTLSPKADFASINQRYLVVWEDVGGGYEVRGQLVGKDGTPIGGDGQPNQNDITISNVSGDEPTRPDVAYDRLKNKFLPVWQVDRASAGDIFARVFEVNGTPSDTEIALVNTSQIDEYFPSITYNSTRGNFLVAYERYADSTSYIGHTIYSDSDDDGLPDDLENMTCTDPDDSDSDDDGLLDGTEDANHNGELDTGETNPCDIDTDGDTVQDDKDDFPNNPNEWLDTDSDGIGNNADRDDDNDGIPDTWEIRYGYNPYVNDASGDDDGDEYSNLQEYRLGTDPTDPNSHPSRAMPWIPLLLDD